MLKLLFLLLLSVPLMSTATAEQQGRADRAMPAGDRQSLQDRDTSGIDCTRLQMLRHPPRLENGEKIQANMELLLLDLFSIDDNARTFSADIMLRVKWYDRRLDRLSGSLLRQCQDELDAQKVWRPGFQFLNAQETSSSEVEPFRLRAGEPNTTLERVHATFTVPVNLRDFPFDTQVLRIQTVNTGPSELIELTTGFQMRPGEMTLAGWRFIDAESSVVDISPPGTDQTIKQASFDFTMARQSGFYLWRIVLPLCLIVAMSWSVFWIHSSQLGAQMEVSSAAVLTLIAFQLSFTDVLPAVSYLTRLDKFVLMSTVLVFLALAESVWTSWLARADRLELAENIDRKCRYGFPLAFALMAFYFWSSMLPATS
jgi:hypothetical protein